MEKSINTNLVNKNNVSVKPNININNNKCIDIKSINLYSINLNNIIYNNNINAFESNIIYTESNNNPDKLSVLFKMKLDKINDNNIILEFQQGYPEQYSLIYSIDNYLIDYIHENSEKILGLELELEPGSDSCTSIKYNTVKNLLMRSIQLPCDINRFPTMIINVNTNCIRNINGDICKLENLRIGQELQVNIVVDKVIFYPSGFKILYLTNSIQVLKNICQSNNYLFSDSDDDLSDNDLDNENDLNCADNLCDSNILDK